MRVEQAHQRVAGEKGHVAHGDDDLADGVAQRRESAAHGVARPVLVLLDGGHRVGRDFREVCLDLLTLVTHDHHQPLGHQRIGCAHGVADHRPARNLVQHLRGARLHSLSLTGSEYHDPCNARPTHADLLVVGGIQRTPGRSRTYFASPDSKSGGPCRKTSRGSPARADSLILAATGVRPQTDRTSGHWRWACARETLTR